MTVLLNKKMLNFLFWNKMAYFGATIVVVGLLGFFLEYPYPRIFKSPHIYMFLLVPAVLVLLLIPSSLFIKSMPSLVHIEFGALHWLWIVYFISYFILAVYFCFGEGFM